MPGQQLLRNFRLLVMPKLSPTMEQGLIRKLLIKPSQYTEPYQHVMDISVHSMLNSSNDVQEMEIELHDESYVVSIFPEAQEGCTLKVGEPIALLCDDKSDLLNADGIEISKSYNAYSSANSPHSIEIALWQAYAKSEVKGCK